MFGFLLIPQFSMVCLGTAVEAMRQANRQAREQLYDWILITHDGAPARPSCGLELTPVKAIGEVEACANIVAVGGLDSHLFGDRKTLSWLRRLARQGANIGAMSTGSHLLAQAGLLDGYRCTIHWEDLEAFAERHPDLDVTGEIFEIDRSRFTCSGGTASLDLMLHHIGVRHGHELAAKVSEQYMHERIRDRHDHQRMNLRSRFGVAHPKLVAVIQRMEENLEEPMSRAALARDVGLSTRQLERLFRKYLKRTPTRFYLEFRLDRARLLLRQTTMSVLDVALACGFVSASHFSKCYREHFGRTPGEERRGARPEASETVVAASDAA